MQTSSAHASTCGATGPVGDHDARSSICAPSPSAASEPNPFESVFVAVPEAAWYSARCDASASMSCAMSGMSSPVLLNENECNGADAASTLGTLQPNWFGVDRAEYFVIRDTPDGKVGFLIDFIRGEDGVWRIEGM